MRGDALLIVDCFQTNTEKFAAFFNRIFTMREKRDLSILELRAYITFLINTFSVRLSR